MVNYLRSRKLFSGAVLVACALALSACSEAFWNSMEEGGSYQTIFYGYVKKVRTVYYTGRNTGGSSTASGALLGTIIGGVAGATLSNGSGVGTLVGAGAGAAIGGAATQGNRTGVNDSDFSATGNGAKATRIVIKKDNGDRVIILQRFTREFMPGDRVMVSTFHDGSVMVRRVRDDRGGYHDRDYDDDTGRY